MARIVITRGPESSSLSLFCLLGFGYGVIVGVPTLDWKSVAKEHYLNSRFRAIESRYAIMRALDGGVSAIISAKGNVLKSADHLEKGTCVLVADVPLQNGGSWFGVWGHGLMPLISSVILLTRVLQTVPSESANKTAGANLEKGEEKGTSAVTSSVPFSRPPAFGPPTPFSHLERCRLCLQYVPCEYQHLNVL